MKPTEITKRNIMFSQPMNEYLLNIGLILGRTNNYLIDTGLGSGSVKPVIEFLKDDNKPIIVINTHSCWDHIWGNFVFSDNIIISSPLCRKSIDEGWDYCIAKNGNQMDGEAKKCLPNTTFNGTLYFPEDEIIIFETPGHTPCSISIYDAKDKVLYAGDNIGDTDDEIVPYIFTDDKTMLNTINIYKQYDFEICISGHNNPQPKSVLARIEAELLKRVN